MNIENTEPLRERNRQRCKRVAIAAADEAWREGASDMIRNGHLAKPLVFAEILCTQIGPQHGPEKPPWLPSKPTDVESRAPHTRSMADSCCALRLRENPDRSSVGRIGADHCDPTGSVRASLNRQREMIVEGSTLRSVADDRPESRIHLLDGFGESCAVAFEIFDRDHRVTPRQDLHIVGNAIFAAHDQSAAI